MKHLVLALIIVVSLALAVVIVDSAFPSPAERQARDARAAARAESARAWASQADERAELVSIGMASLLAILVATCAGIGVAVVRLAVVRSGTLHASKHTALFPAVLHRGQWQVVNEPGAQTFAALPQRPTAAVTRALLGGMRATGGGAAPAPIIDATAEPVEMPFDGAVDLVNRPHTILLGRTGSGKSTAGYSIAQAIARRYRAEFVIAEPGGVSWGSQCAAADVRDIADVLSQAEQEMRRRQAMLVAEDVQHITQLQNPPPFLVILLEELEDTLDSLKMISQADAQRARIALRNIAREGRKAGTCLLAVTQFGRSDVLDSHVRHNMGALYLFQNAANVGEMLRLPSGVRLDRLPTGTAWDFHSGRMVQFPKAARPMLPARASGTSQPLLDPVRRYVPPETPGFEPTQGGIPISVPISVPLHVPMPAEPDEAITEAQRRAILDAYRRTGSLKGAQRQLWPDLEVGGWKFYVVRDVVKNAGIL